MFRHCRWMLKSNVAGLRPGLLLLWVQLAACHQNQSAMLYNEIQLTSDPQGHTIHNTQVFSPGDEWIAFDSRNEENRIGSTGIVGIVNVQTGELREMYHTRRQTEYGPGVGAVTFSPKENKLL